jgi:hypothetical protein
MSLPASEERALTRIEQMLLARDPRLKSLFTIFTRLTGQEAMPATEQLQPRRWRPHSAPVIAIVLAIIVGVVVVSSLTAPARGCGTLQPTAAIGAQPTASAASPADHGCPPRSLSKTP